MSCSARLGRRNTWLIAVVFVALAAFVSAKTWTITATALITAGLAISNEVSLDSAGNPIGGTGKQLQQLAKPSNVTSPVLDARFALDGSVACFILKNATDVLGLVNVALVYCRHRDTGASASLSGRH